MRIRIGRAPESDIVVDERWDTVSNEHADIELKNGSLVFVDHSSNGTIINKQKIHNKEVGIYPGDVIYLAGTFELGWDVINSYFPKSKRPTVTKNIRGEQTNEDISRKTVQFNDVTTPKNNNSRETQQYVTAEHTHTPRVDQNKHQTNSNYGHENTYSQAEMDRLLEKWNWGGFLSTWIWAIFHHITWPVLIIPIALIPYVGQVAGIALAVYLGMCGTKLAWEKRTDDDFAKFINTQKKWTIIGIVLFILNIAINAISVYYMLQLL